MLPDGRRLGAHLPLGDGMVKAVERAHEIGADALQVFVDNPTAWRRRSTPPKELPAFRRRLAELAIGPLAVHASYLINLAGPDQDLFAKSVATLTDELRAAETYGAAFVNVHIGSHRGSGAEAGAHRVADGIAAVLGETSEGAGAPRLVLENSAGGGFGLGATVDELARVLSAIARRGVPARRVAICLDTAHLWGAGYRISDPDEVDALVEAFDREIGLERLVMVHLNDSGVALGSHHDRHEHVGAGGVGEVGMAAVLRHPGLAQATYYIETPGMDDGFDAINMARARALAEGRPVAALPDEEARPRFRRARAAPEPEPEQEAV